MVLFTTVKIVNLFGHGDSAVTINHVNFLKERSPLGSSEAITLPDGSTFSVNDIRDFELRTILPSYNSNMMHKIAIHGAGFDEKELRDLVNSNYDRLIKSGNKHDANALMNGYKIITGQARRGAEGITDHLLAAAQSATFGSRNTYMGLMNITETQKLLADNSWRSMLDNIPIMRDMFAWNTKQGRETLQSMHDYVFGKYLDDTFRPRYKDYVGALTANPDTVQSQITIKTVAGIRKSADNYAFYNPGSAILKGTTNGIINAARKTLVGDMVRNVFESGNLPKYLRDEQKLNSLSITNEQFEGIKNLIREHVQYNGKGDYVLKDAQKWVADPRTADLFRLGDNYANRIILRPETISSMKTKEYPRALNLLTQFKMFSVRSVNGKMMQMFGDAKYNRQYMDNALQFVLSLGLAGIGYAGQTYGLSNTMPEEKRDQYMAGAFEPNNLMFNILSRSSVIGGPLGLISTAYTVATGSGPGQYLRSTVTPELLQAKEPGIFKGSFSQSPTFKGGIERIIQQSPALSFTANLFAAPYYTAQMLASNPYSYDHTDYSTAAFNNWRQVIPNNPLTYMFLDQIFRTQGMDSNYLRNH